MKKYSKIVFPALLSILLMGCGEKELTPTHDDIDWYRVDDGTSAAQQLRYRIYTDYGTSVMYSDTIGMRVRTSLGGEQKTEYKILDIAYMITSRLGSVPRYFLSGAWLEEGDMTDIEAGLEFTRDYVLPLIDRSVMPLSFLLCDSIATLQNSDVRGHHTLYALYSLNTTLIGRLPYIERMTEREKKHHAGRIAGTVYARHIINKYETQFEEFSALSLSDYGVRKGTSSNYASASAFMGKDNWLTHGFLRFNTSSLIYLTMLQPSTVNYDLGTIDTCLAGYYCPSLEQDLAEYIALVLVGDDQWVYNTYGSHAKVVTKYDTIKRVFASFRESL